MGIEAASSTVTSAAATQNSVQNNSAQKTSSSDATFKDEMAKVSESESKQDSKTSEKTPSKDSKSSTKLDSNKNKTISSNKENKSENKLLDSNTISVQEFINNQISLNSANLMLSNDIEQMMSNSLSADNINGCNWVFGFSDSSKSSLKMNESDADFFINLTKNDNINVQTINSQAQTMMNNGADITDIRQSAQVSQTLLNALSQARENNQPLRIDFDQNISVILRVGRDGAISAQFIPGDKAVEQYLRNNIETLKNSFDEQELPYHELSYSNSSKEQNQRRRQQRQQGE